MCLLVVALDGYLSPDGVGDEALLVREMVQSLLVCWRRQLVAAVDNPGVELDAADPENSTLVFRHLPNSLVFVAIHLKTLLIREHQVKEHMAARHSGNEYFLRINVRGVRIG